MDELQEGIAALRAGDRVKARELSVNVLRQNKEDLCAWMYNVSESEKDRNHCLEQILRLSSSN
jgi:hypothetical protein